MLIIIKYKINFEKIIILQQIQSSRHEPAPAICIAYFIHFGVSDMLPSLFYHYFFVIGYVRIVEPVSLSCSIALLDPF